MVNYLVTKEVLDIPTDRPIVMVDGTVPSWSPKFGDLHFDHHRPGGADVQLQEIGLEFQWERNEDTVFITTMVDADACAAAAWVQLTDSLCQAESYNVFILLSAIAYDCDHLGVPQGRRWDPYRNFAAQAVAAMKVKSDQLATQMGLSPNRKEWSDADRKHHASEAFRVNTEWLINAAMANCAWPGELGEAQEYFRDLERQRPIVSQKICLYRNCAILDQTDLNYTDPRLLVDWARIHNTQSVTLSMRRDPALPNAVPYDGTTYAYTLGSVPLHPDGTPQYSTRGVWSALTELENHLREVNNLPPLSTHWGGRETVGGSPFKDPAITPPERVIDCVLRCINN